MTSIAFIGTEASGKTILVSALAKHLASLDNHERFLDPQNAFTQQYVDRIWSVLQEGDWPPSTPPGTLPQLHWKLHLPKLPSADLRVADPGGQDLRRLFADAVICPGQIPAELEELAAYCRAADIVVFLVNLKDFLGVSNQELRTANELALKFALEYVNTAAGHRHCCVVFTQIDLYRDLVEAEGDWLHVARRHLPLLYGAHLRERRVPVFAIAAVSATQVAVCDDDTPRRVPAHGFTSQGFDELLGWIESIERNLAFWRPIDDALFWTTRHAIAIGGWIARHVVDAGIAIGVSLLILYFALRTPPPPPPPPLRPTPVLISSKYKIDGIIWKDVIFFGSVMNKGAAGTITVIGTATKGADTWREAQVLDLAPGESRDFEIRLKGIGHLDGLKFDVSPQ